MVIEHTKNAPLGHEGGKAQSARGLSRSKKFSLKTLKSIKPKNHDPKGRKRHMLAKRKSVTQDRLRRHKQYGFANIKAMSTSDWAITK